MPVATSTGGVQPAVVRRESQMPTSTAPSRVPPNHAATSPSLVSAIVEACALANGAVSKTNSDATAAPSAGVGTVNAGSSPLFLIAPTAAGEDRNPISDLAAATAVADEGMPA